MNRIIIDFEQCKGCYLCIEACPKGIIEISNGLNAAGCYPAQQMSDAPCTACALCARVCPDAAITVYREVKDASEDEEEQDA